MKVAIQGEPGSFSHEAAGQMLPRCTVVPCARSAEVFDRLQQGSVAAAVIPIENSLAGTVAEHADLLLAHGVFIQAEFLLRIVHNVIASARRSGVGSLLLRAAENRLRQAHCKSVDLETAVDNISALSFYKRHHYSVIKTFPRYYSNGVDALVLQKDLV